MRGQNRMRQSHSSGLRARHTALTAFAGVIASGRRLRIVSKPDDPLDTAELAMAQRIAAASLRCLGRADHVLENLMQRQPPAAARNILRLALAEFHACGTKPHAVVDQAVRLMRAEPHLARYGKLANAVLRRAVGPEGRELWAVAGPARMPNWIAAPLRRAHGPETVRRIEAAHEGEPPLDITPRQAHDAGRLARLLAAEILPGGSLRLRRQGQITALEEFQQGNWWVQDTAAATPVRLLGELKGRRVFDLCAAPGGKTMQCAAAGADTVAVDRSAERLRTLAENLARTGLRAETVCADALNWDGGGDADIVIVDAPCSATGTVRRHPDIPHRRDAKNRLDKLAKTQRRLLAHALSLTKPGGRVLYCVCSLLPAEGEEISRWAMAKLGAQAAPLDVAAAGASLTWQTAEGGLRLRPDYWLEKGGMDGFYAVVLIAKQH